MLQCLVRYLHPVDQHPARIRKTDRSFENKLNFEDIKFLVTIKDIHKIEKKRNSIVFGYKNKEKYLSKICIKKLL